MAGVRKRKSSAEENMRKNIREIVIVRKRKQLDEEKTAIEEKVHKGKQRAIAKKRNEIDEDRAVASKKVNEKEELNGKKRAIVKQRKQLDEERAIVKKRNEIDEDVAIGKTIDEKEEQKGKEIVIVKKRNRLDDEEEIANVKKIKGEKEHNRVCKSLPQELWTENILTRLPARTLARCRFMSKLWYNSIYKDKRFAAIHNLQNKNKLSLIFNVHNVFRRGMANAFFFSLQDKEDDDLHPEFLTRLETGSIYELVGYCNGLECIKQVTRHDAAADDVGLILVVNPIRSESLTLSYVTPAGGFIYLCHGFGFDSLSQVYKAVIIFTAKDNNEFLCMVITLGTCSWRKITTTTKEISRPPGSSPFPNRMVTRVSRSFCRPATFCGGDLLWRTTSEVDNGCEIEMLLSFDLHNEKLQFIRLPAESTLTSTMHERQYLAIDHLLEFKGYPCIARSEKIIISNSDHRGHRCDYLNCCCCCCKVHMHILKDKVKQVWIREKTFDVQIKDQDGLLPAPLCCYFGTSAITPPRRILTLSDQVLFYWFNGESLIFYNLLEKYLKVVKCSRSYPRIFRTKMNELLDHGIGDDDNIYCPYMDYHLHAQVENLVSVKTFIPEGAETSKFDCFEEFLHSIKSNPPPGWVVVGRKSFNCYVFRRDKEVDVEVSDDVQGHPNESCSSKHSRSEKKSGKAMPKQPLIAKWSSKSTGSEFCQTMRKCAIFEKQKDTNGTAPVEEWVAVLKRVPDLDEDLKLEAVDFLGGD